MNKTVKFHFKKAEDSSGYLLWQVTMSWQRKIKKELDKTGITHTQFVLLASLAWLSKTNASVTQVDIANHSNTDRMMVSKVLRTLITKKFIERKAHELDTRAKTISLTQHGQTVLQKALKQVEQVDHDFFSALNPKVKNFNLGLIKLIKENS